MYYKIMEMMRRKSVVSVRMFALWWLVLIFLAGTWFQGGVASARQDVTLTASPEPTMEVTETPLPEETLLSAASETQETLPPVSPVPESEITEEAPSATPSVVPENLATPSPVPSKVIAFSGEYVPDEILVRFRKSASTAEINQCLFPSGAEPISAIEDINVWVIQVPDGTVGEAIAAISACPQVRYAEPNYVAFATDTIPSDANFSFQYGLRNVRAPQGWDYSTGSAAVTIAILDTGVDLDHPDLISKIVPGYDFINNDSLADDDHFQSHGTHVAGIAAASSNNGVGVAGVSWGARIMPVKVLGPLGSGPLSRVADGIIWAANQGAQVINLSLGSDIDSLALRDAVNYAYGRGCVLVAAAGNNNGTVLYPAIYPNVIAVGSVDGNNTRVSNSNTGEALDLVAPGLLIYSTIRNGYGYNSGTSMAAPYVSGLAAVLYGVPGNGSSSLVTFQMTSSARDLGAAGFDYEYGFGLIQMDAALKQAFSLFSPSKPENPSHLFAMPTVPTFVLNSLDTPTFFPTPTLTSTATSTIIPIANSETPTTTPSQNLEAPQSRAFNLSSWQLPCAGMTFLLAGLLLLWAGRRKR
jgi:thermitase